MIGIYRELPGVRIPGGSEDVLMDLAVRQLLKKNRKQKMAMRNRKYRRSEIIMIIRLG